MVKRVRQIKLYLNTSFVEHSLAGKAAIYLKSGEIPIRTGVEIAISAFFAPITAALNGASLREVEKLCLKGETQLNSYKQIALNYCYENTQHEEKNNKNLNILKSESKSDSAIVFEAINFEEDEF